MDTKHPRWPRHQTRHVWSVTYCQLKQAAFTLAVGQPKRTDQSACSGRVTALRTTGSALGPNQSLWLWFVPEAFYDKRGFRYQPLMLRVKERSRFSQASALCSGQSLTV